jgi:hypothetical protein
MTGDVFSVGVYTIVSYLHNQTEFPFKGSEQNLTDSAHSTGEYLKE